MTGVPTMTKKMLVVETVTATGDNDDDITIAAGSGKDITRSASATVGTNVM
jgi:hypothetical protein